MLEDDAGRTIETKLTNGATVKESASYAYANDGNVIKSPATVAIPNILHDSLSRITQDRSDGPSTTVQTFAFADDSGVWGIKTGYGTSGGYLDWNSGVDSEWACFFGTIP